MFSFSIYIFYKVSLKESKNVILFVGVAPFTVVLTELAKQVSL